MKRVLNWVFSFSLLMGCGSTLPVVTPSSAVPPPPTPAESESEPQSSPEEIQPVHSDAPPPPGPEQTSEASVAETGPPSTDVTPPAGHGTIASDYSATPPTCADSSAALSGDTTRRADRPRRPLQSGKGAVARRPVPGHNYKRPRLRFFKPYIAHGDENFRARLTGGMKSRIKRCAQMAIRRGEIVRGCMILRARVTYSGYVLKTRILGIRGTLSRSLQGCIRRIAKRFRFKAPPSEGTDVQWKLYLETR